MENDCVLMYGTSITYFPVFAEAHGWCSEEREIAFVSTPAEAQKGNILKNMGF